MINKALCNVLRFCDLSVQCTIKPPRWQHKTPRPTKITPRPSIKLHNPQSYHTLRSTSMLMATSQSGPQYIACAVACAVACGVWGGDAGHMPRRILYTSQYIYRAGECVGRAGYIPRATDAYTACLCALFTARVMCVKAQAVT